MSTIIALLLRHGIGALGAVLASKGYVDSGLDTEAVTGALMTLGAVVWSVVEKKKSGALPPPPAD